MSSRFSGDSEAFYITLIVDLFQIEGNHFSDLECILIHNPEYMLVLVQPGGDI